jgi:ketosteroid isomerase-like protein
MVNRRLGNYLVLNNIVTFLNFLCYRPAMKRALALFAALCMALPSTTTQTTSPKPEVREWPMSAEEANIRQVSEDWIRFYNAEEAAKVAALYTDDGYYLSAHILAHGKQAIEAYWERGIKAGGHIDSVKPLTLYYTGDLAYCAGTYQATNGGVIVDGRILIVLRKVNGKWLMAAHETVVRDQPL